MEGDSHEKLRSANFFIKNAENFELDLKSKLKWSKQEWYASGESGSRSHTLCNSLHYWKTKLKPAIEDSSIVITLFNKANNVRVELLDIIDEIEKLDSSFEVVGIANFRNPRYVGLYFANKEIRDRVQETFRIMNDNFVVYLAWAVAQEINIAKLTVHWMPLSISIDVIKKQLDKYVVFIEEERKKLVFMSGRVMPTAKVEFKIKYKKDVTPEIIPHLTEINKMEALITIGGRKPLCLSCDRLGHISKNCDLRFCATCRGLKLKKHVCDSVLGNSTYAQIVSGKNVNEVEKDPDASNKDEVLISNQTSENQKFFLEKKINHIEILLKESAGGQSLAGCSGDKKEKRIDSTETDQKIMETTELSSGEWGEEDDELSDSSMELAVEIEGNETQEIDSLKKKESRKNNEIISVKEHLKGEDEVQLKKKKRKKIEKKNQSGQSQSGIITDVKKEGNALRMTTRSYAKPNPFNVRKMKENAKYKKTLGEQEFVFEN